MSNSSIIGSSNKRTLEYESKVQLRCLINYVAYMLSHIYIILQIWMDDNLSPHFKMKFTGMDTFYAEDGNITKN